MAKLEEVKNVVQAAKIERVKPTKYQLATIKKTVMHPHEGIPIL